MSERVIEQELTVMPINHIANRQPNTCGLTCAFAGLRPYNRSVHTHTPDQTARKFCPTAICQTLYNHKKTAHHSSIPASTPAPGTGPAVGRRRGCGRSQGQVHLGSRRRWLLAFDCMSEEACPTRSLRGPSLSEGLRKSSSGSLRRCICSCRRLCIYIPPKWRRWCWRRDLCFYTLPK